jgi:hypothetical protein
MIPDYVYENAASNAAGVILMGSFLSRKYKTGKTSTGRPQVEFPVRVLTIGGELDGLCRISRIAEALYTQITSSADPTHASTYFPVTVVTGLNHMLFASGEPSAFVKNNDLRAETSESTAHFYINKDITLFIRSIVTTDYGAVTGLRDRVTGSTAVMQPIVDALLMESYQQFLPPCYCENKDEYGYLQYGTCPDTPTCYGGLKWTTEQAQKIMAGLKDPHVQGLQIVSTDSMHLVTEEQPSCHLPHIHGNPDNSANPGSNGTPPLCPSPVGCTLNITTVTEQIYENGGELDVWRIHYGVDWLDTGYLPISATELKTKMKSRQSIWNAAGILDADYDVTDKTIADGGKGDRCAEINQAAIDWAVSKAAGSTRNRFLTYGQKLSVGPDLSTCAAGPCWIWDPLRWEKDDVNNTVSIQSVWFGTENKNNFPCGEDNLVPCDAGFHYCKLLSPARALEWIYVDGLRNKLGTKNF